MKFFAITLLIVIIIIRSFTTNTLTQTKEKIISFYEQSLPFPHGSLVAGMALGAKRSISKDFYNKLISTGTSHVVVASGMNLTLVSGFIFNIFIKFWTRKRAIIVTLLSILIYCALVGFEAPIVRAALMLLIVYLSQLTGRLISPVRALFSAGFVMLIFNPSWIKDLGFILSFSATLSLILFEAKVDRLIKFIPDLFREWLSTSLAVQILTAPIILLTFGRINFLSPLINALIAPVIIPITIIGIITGFVSFVYEPLARLLLYIVYPLTSWFTFIINLFA